MTLSTKDQQSIHDQADAWLDQNFGVLDIGGSPSVNHPAEDKHDDRFARHWRDTAFNSGEVRSFLENPDSDAMTETDSGDLRLDVRDRRAEETVGEIKRAFSGVLTNRLKLR